MNVRFEIAVLVVMVLAAAGCANNDGADGAFESDAGSRPDAGLWRGDASSDPRTDAGELARRDAGRRDSGARVSADSGLAADAGSAPAPDAGPPPGAVNDYCSGAIDITAGGAIAGSTCLGSHDDADPLCGGAPSPEVFYYIDSRRGMVGTVYRLTVDSEYAIGFSPGACGAAGTCTIASPYSTIVSGGGGLRWYFFVEKLGGGCGEFTLNVEGPDFSG